MDHRPGLSSLDISHMLLSSKPTDATCTLLLGASSSKPIEDSDSMLCTSCDIRHFGFLSLLANQKNVTENTGSTSKSQCRQ